MIIIINNAVVVIVKQRRLTKQKKAIKLVIDRSDRHLTAVEVHQKVKRQLKNVSLATVYRNLEQMADDHLLDSVYVAGMPKWFEKKKNQCHGHLFCHQCRQLSEVTDCKLCQAKTALGQKCGFIQDEVRFVASGLCKKCYVQKYRSK